MQHRTLSSIFHPLHALTVLRHLPFHVKQPSIRVHLLCLLFILVLVLFRAECMPLFKGLLRFSLQVRRKWFVGICDELTRVRLLDNAQFHERWARRPSRMVLEKRFCIVLSDSNLASNALICRCLVLPSMEFACSRRNICISSSSLSSSVFSVSALLSVEDCVALCSPLHLARAVSSTSSIKETLKLLRSSSSGILLSYIVGIVVTRLLGLSPTTPCAHTIQSIACFLSHLFASGLTQWYLRRRFSIASL